MSPLRSNRSSVRPSGCTKPCVYRRTVSSEPDNVHSDWRIGFRSPRREHSGRPRTLERLSPLVARGHSFVVPYSRSPVPYPAATQAGMRITLRALLETRNRTVLNQRPQKSDQVRGPRSSLEAACKGDADTEGYQLTTKTEPGHQETPISRRGTKRNGDGAVRKHADETPPHPRELS